MSSFWRRKSSSSSEKRGDRRRIFEVSDLPNASTAEDEKAAYGLKEWEQGKDPNVEFAKDLTSSVTSYC